MASNSSDSDGEGPSQPIKRGRHPEQWKQNVVKAKRAKGEAYVSRATKREVPARQIGLPCDCPLQCFEKVGNDNINTLFKRYNDLGDYNAQSHYLHKCVKSKPVKRVRVKDKESRRKNTREYTVSVNNETFTVCKKAFSRMHGISEGRVRLVLERAAASEPSDILPDDQRGRQPPANKTSDEAREYVVSFIQKLPTCSSHYSRAKSPNRMYLPPGSTHTSVYRAYCDEITENDLQHLKVSNYMFQTILRNFNIGVAPPKSDTCNFCDEYKIKMAKLVEGTHDAEILELRMERVPHISHAKIAQQFLKTFSADRSRAVAVISMDLQQTLATPRLTSGVQYYKRKMWTYNFGIHSCKDSKAYFYVWNEVQAKRGSSEVCSCLDHFVNNYVSEEVEKLLIFSDNCAGQNKNINIVMNYLRWVHGGKFSRVEHYFMEPGHSYLPCDRDFGNFELALKGHEVYTTNHYITHMEQARPNNPITVVEMQSNDFYDFSHLEKHCTKAGQKGSGFKNAKRFIVTAEDKRGITVSAGFGDYHTPVFIKLQKGKGSAYKEAFNLSRVELPLKYPNGVKLDDNKLKDLQDLQRFIPEPYADYYTHLFTQQEGLGQALAAEEDHPLEDDDFLDY